MTRLFLLVAMLLIALPAHSQAPTVWVDDLTWPEVRDAITGGKRTAIIYVGSSEQNGPHMVIGKHNFIARALAQRIAEELGDALVYPARLNNSWVKMTGCLPPVRFCGKSRWIFEQRNGLA